MELYPEGSGVNEESSKEAYIQFLIDLDVPGLTKKYMYIQWCDEHGEQLTKDDIDQFYEHPSG